MLKNPATSERRFYSGMAIAMLLAVFYGFSHSFYLKPLYPNWPATHNPWAYVHGVVFTLWILLFLLQTSLIATDNRAIHRKTGAFGALLATSMVILGIYVALLAAGSPHGFVNVPVPPLRFLAIPVIDILVFGFCVAMGVSLRRQAQSHKRWMLLATLALLPPAFARFPQVAPYGPPAFFGLTDLFILALIVWDICSQGRVQQVTWRGGLLIVVCQILSLIVSGTNWWVTFAKWATDLIK